MKRAIVFVMLAVFLLSVTFPTASAALMGTWVPSVSAVRGTELTETVVQQIFDAVAKLNANLLTFEGLLKAYSVNENSSVIEEQVFLASDAIGASLEALNAELTDTYSSLEDKEQSAVIEAYSSLGSYLVDLADEANQIFQGDQEKSTPLFEVGEVKDIFPNSPGRIWVGSASAI